MTTVVALLTDTASVATCLDVASVAAAPIGGEIEAFHARLNPESLIIAGEEVMTPTRRTHLLSLLDADTRAIRQSVEDWGARFRTLVTWNEQEGDSVTDIVSSCCKASDLIVLVGPSERKGREALDAVLFRAGRPLLLAPSSPSVRVRFDAHIAIAWKPSDPARHALTASIPWLKHALRVSLLMVNERPEAPALPDEALTILASLPLRRLFGVSTSETN